MLSCPRAWVTGMIGFRGSRGPLEQQPSSLKGLAIEQEDFTPWRAAPALEKPSFPQGSQGKAPWPLCTISCHSGSPTMCGPLILPATSQPEGDHRMYFWVNPNSEHRLSPWCYSPYPQLQPSLTSTKSTDQEPQSAHLWVPLVLLSLI